MTEPSPIRGAKVAARPFPLARSGRKRFREKSSSLCSGMFPENLACGGGLQEAPPKTGMVSPLKQEDYESKRTYQKNSGQQMDKAPRAGRYGSRHIQLALYTRHISRMDRRGHCMFQRNLQVPLPGSLPARGTGHPPVHPESPGFLKSDSREHKPILSLQHKGAVWTC